MLWNALVVVAAWNAATATTSRAVAIWNLILGSFIPLENKDVDQEYNGLVV